MLLALLWIVFVGVSAAAADARGRRVVEGLLLGLLLGPVGMLIEGLLPAREGVAASAVAQGCADAAPPGPSAAVPSADRPLSPWLFVLIMLAVGGLLALGLGVFWLPH